MKCEIISVGTELLLGDIVNTNAQYLSKSLADLGFDVMFQATVGDNENRLTQCLDQAFSRSEMVIATGGLGPTPDDITKEVCAKYFDMQLEENEETKRDLLKFFNHKNTTMPKSNLKQALLPKGSIMLKNDNGTAPGCILEKDGKTIVILPGPPYEMKPMFEDKVVPYIKKYSSFVIKSHTIRSFGIGESLMAEKTADLLECDNPTVAPYAKRGEALLRVSAKAENEQEAEKMMQSVIEDIKSRLGGVIYGIDEANLENAVVKLLKDKGLSVALAESCTAGLVAKRITDVSGASDVFHCGVVSYANEIKHKILGVSLDTLAEVGAVSEEVAKQMALGVWKVSGSSIGASISGIAGPNSDDSEKPVGLAYLAVTNGEKTVVKKIMSGRSSGSDCRDYNRHIFSSNVLNEIRLFALEL